MLRTKIFTEDEKMTLINIFKGGVHMTIIERNTTLLHSRKKRKAWEAILRTYKAQNHPEIDAATSCFMEEYENKNRKRNM